MTQFAAINLQTLRFDRASSGTGNSKPYIWPVVLWMDNSGMSVTNPAVELAEQVIVNGMHAGDTADIPASVGELRAQIEDGFLGLILVVALWEQRDTPGDAVRAGYQTFSSELRAAIQDNLLALLDPSGRDAAIKTVKTRVSGKVSSAIENALTLYQKLEKALGWLHIDSSIGSDFQLFSTLASTATTLRFGDETENDYEIQGNLQVFPTEISFPDVLEFGQFFIGEPSNPKPLVITNTGSVPATVSLPPPPPPHGAVFLWTIGGDHTINPGESLAIDITFIPSVEGSNLGQFRFTSNAIGSPHVVSLSGKGVHGHPQ